MLTTSPRVRITGHGTQLRVRKKGDWDSDSLALLRETCRASTALVKTLAEAIHRARAAGISWDDIGRSLGVEAGTKQALVEALGEGRQAMLEHQLRRTP